MLTAVVSGKGTLRNLLRLWGATLGANLVGGLLLVTVLRLVQVGGVEIAQERRRPADAPRPAAQVPHQ